MRQARLHEREEARPFEAFLKVMMTQVHRDEQVDVVHGDVLDQLVVVAVLADDER